tara:strand:- start:43 stop:1551 length:1509 start_codon:yes stop_codon:yes gene_type:complete
MPTKKINFSLAPLNDNPVNISNGEFVDGFSHKNGFPTMKFSIPAQDVLLDISNLYLSGQIIVNDSDGSPLTTAVADGATQYDKVLGTETTMRKQMVVNKSNFNGVASVIDKVVIQSKKTQTELSTIINYSAYNSLKMGNKYSQDDYYNEPFIRNVCAGVASGLVDRHTNNMPPINESRLTSYDDKYAGTFFSIPLDVALLQSQSIHLGNDFSGGLLITLHLSPDASVFHSRFRSVNSANFPLCNATGVSYVLKHVKLEGKYAIPTQQDLADYNPVITMNSRVNLMNDLVSSDNSNTYTPQLKMVKGIINTFLDDNQSNNYTLNQNNCRVPLGLVQYQQAKNNIRYPNDYATKIVPNAQSIASNGFAVNPNLAEFPISIQGDSELRLQFGRALLGGRLPNHTSATLSLTNESLKSDYDTDNANTNQMRGLNTNPDLLGLAVDYSNNIGQIQNYVNQDYELKVQSGVSSGRTNLPISRRNRIEVQESYIRNFSQIDLRTLQKSQ